MQIERLRQTPPWRKAEKPFRCGPLASALHGVVRVGGEREQSRFV